LEKHKNFIETRKTQKPKITWLNNIKDWMKMNTEWPLRADNRNKWRADCGCGQYPITSVRTDRQGGAQVIVRFTNLAYSPRSITACSSAGDVLINRENEKQSLPQSPRNRKYTDCTNWNLIGNTEIRSAVHFIAMHQQNPAIFVVGAWSSKR